MRLPDQSSFPPPPSPGSKLGVVLSGGGSRGAYEVGVLTYAFGDIVKRVGHPPPVRVIAGTSVGAVNGAFLASAADDVARGVAKLETLWSELQLADVITFGVRQAVALHRVLLGGRRTTGIFDATPLVQLVGEGIDWRRLARNIRRGHLDALSVSATKVATGQPTVFIDQRRDLPLPAPFSPQVQIRGQRIGPAHVLASAAIPLIFAPIPINQHLHCDGGLRLNTPLAPAIHLGADRLFVVGCSDPHGDGLAGLTPGLFPGAPFLLGKVLNAFLIDHLNADLLELHKVNGLLQDGIAAFGDEFIDKMNAVAAERGEPARRILQAFSIHPSVDLGHIASDHLNRNRLRFGATLGRQFLKLLDVGEGGDADLASYLLFDGSYARELIALGRADAKKRKDELEAFLYGDADPLPDAE